MNMNYILQMYNQFANNPQQVLQKYGIPQECDSPESVMKYLVDNGKVNQQQINQVNQLYRTLFNR